MNREQLKELLLETRDTIKKNLEGSDTREETIDKYTRIRQKYTIATENIVVNENAAILRSILYYNNSENFAKITALHSCYDGAFNLVEYYGDKNLLDGLHDILKEIIDPESGKDYYEVKLTEKDNLLYMFYCSVQRDGNRIIILSSISSSLYFEKNTFINISGIIGKLFGLSSLLNQSSAVDFFSEMLDKIDRSIREQTDSGAEILGYYYIFNSIEEIFKNASLSTFSDLTNIIVNLLKNHYGNDSKIFILSLTEFLVLESAMEDHQERSNLKKKLNFIYNELPLPYESIIIDFSDYTSIRNIWEKMSLFSRYIINGDISL